MLLADHIRLIDTSPTSNQTMLPHHRFAVATATEPDTLERTVMKGCCVVFHNHKRVPVLPTLYNPSWHLTAGRSDV